MININVKNYQIIKDVTVDVSGITMVVGPTNNGKSALVRSIESAMFSNQGSDFINYDADECEVSISFPPDDERENLEMTWRKGREGGSKYLINGVEYKKTGKVAPEELEKAGLKDIVIRDKKERLFVWAQMEEPFLVFSTPSYIFDFISQLMQDKKLTPVLKQMALDSKVIRTELVTLEGQVTAYQNSILQLKQRETILAQITSVENDFLNLRKWKVRYERLIDAKKNYDSVIPQLEQVSHAVSLIENDIVLPLMSFADVPEKVQVYRQLLISWSSLSEVNSVLSEVGISVDSQSKIVNAIQLPERGVIDREERLLDIKTSLESFYTQIEQSKHAVNQYQDVFHRLNDIPEESLIGKYVSLLNIKDSVFALNLSIDEVSKGIVSGESLTVSCINDLEAYKVEVGICPLCNTSFDEHEGGLHGKRDS